MKQTAGFTEKFTRFFGYIRRQIKELKDSALLFKRQENTLCCGLAGIVSFRNRKETDDHFDIASLDNLDDMVKRIEGHSFLFCKENNLLFDNYYLGGDKLINSIAKAVSDLKEDNRFFDIFTSREIQDRLSKLTDRLQVVIDREAKLFCDNMGRFSSYEADIMSHRIESLKDTAWSLTFEIADNIKKVAGLLSNPQTINPSSVKIFKGINAVLNSMDRLEVRGRDSAGISLMFILNGPEFEKFKNVLDSAEKNENLPARLKERSTQKVHGNMSVSIDETEDETGKRLVAVAITYKVASEVGNLGDNINFLRKQIRNDTILHRLITFPCRYHTVSAHTRWASVGVVSELNCHPVDNRAAEKSAAESGIIHVCLNGDIDNYLDLKREHEKGGNIIHKDITTDTKIIPLQIERYVKEGFDVEEAFRRAVNDFDGSHAISMHTNLAPGRLFLAQKGSGQALFVGLAKNHYMPASEVYGFVEETPAYIRIDGGRGKSGNIQGQIFVLNQETRGGLDGIKAMLYDGTPVELGKEGIKHTDITTRDIDRQGFYHYFLKEISESPVSVEKTLQNRWKIEQGRDRRHVIALNEGVFPKSLQEAVIDRRIRRILFVGQGTAGVAALACANILNYYINEPMFHIDALKSSELSGFKLGDHDDARSMEDTLVIAVSQSGTTTDTNRSIDMARERGAYTLAIVNRRDSDITFKVDGVMYTSSGRDIEMSVASTKAFYSQIVAGALLGLYIAGLKRRRDDEFVSEEIKHLLELPSHMIKILSMQSRIKDSAERLAVTKTYWATVGSGPNKASADEVRIKLSELCYMTISSDYVEDKKHIDLSSEPLIIVCAAGTRRSVVDDIIKDTAIFQAHKATIIVIADEGEDRFSQYAEDVFHVPAVSEHLAPILNTLVGHLWGYYAALAINEGSRFMHIFREDVQSLIGDHTKKGLDIYEVILEKSFREKIAYFYNEFRRKKAQNRFPTTMGFKTASDLTLLLKYLSGRLPVSDFELDFGIKGTPLNMLNSLFKYLEESVNFMARPVDAIKHQAKTVTVGTSRISEKMGGILFDALAAQNFNISQLTNKNIVVLKNIQSVVSDIKGSSLYRIGSLNLLGEPTDKTTIEVKKKEGSLRSIPSRVEKDTMLKGTKRIIVQEGNVYIGKGRKDGRSIVIIPIISASPQAPNMLEYLLLLNVSFKEAVPLSVKIKALGGKYDRIKSTVQESSVVWNDRYLESVEIQELFGGSAEKIGNYIVKRSRSPLAFKDASTKPLNRG